MRVLIAIDPSGNFEEGKGTTGIAVFVHGELLGTTVLSASDYDTAEHYWYSHSTAIRALSSVHMTEGEKYEDVVEVVCESYKLQKQKAIQQSGSWLETPQLIGYMRVAVAQNNIPFIFQDPPIKTRFNDSVLEKLGVVEKRGRSYFRNDLPITMHERDAIRHGMYYIRYGKK